MPTSSPPRAAVASGEERRVATAPRVTGEALSVLWPVMTAWTPKKRPHPMSATGKTERHPEIAERNGASES